MILLSRNDGYNFGKAPIVDSTPAVHADCKGELVLFGTREKVSTPPTGQPERRVADRFPIERELRYKVLNKKFSNESGEGRTVNISSSGILFATNEVLLPGRKIEVSLSWPAQLNEKCALKLVARGKVVRYERGMAALAIQQYEFRTQRLAALASQESA